jgi:molybdate transport system substrate-binding protein
VSRLTLAAVVVSSLVAVLAGACGDNEARLRVLAASSLADAFDDMAAAYEERTGTEVVVSTAGSATIRTQLVEGAPADVVALADPTSMEQVVDAGVLHPGSEPMFFAANHLVLVVPSGNPAGIGGLDDLEGALLAVCAPEVPCGRLARRLAAANGVTLRPTTEPSSVRAVLSAVELGEVDAGLVYASDVRDGVEVVPVPGASELVNLYPVAAVTDTPASRAFVDFVTSTEGADILTGHGFGAAR